MADRDVIKGVFFFAGFFFGGGGAFSEVNDYTDAWDCKLHVID